MSDISQDIVQMRKIINQLEMLNANPYISGKKQINDATQQLKTHVMLLEIKVADYALDDRE